ncbi:ATP-binding cassette domain-containing protein [Paenibacillus sp. 32O-W]|uniref:ABC transporter ATP-binding protein n=1 Tax=Paenibacillus sp. 32O-W TaxID=1695218 RepID=UPI0011A29BEA|nr:MULTISPECIES: ATP-binding cassette domain-containing protein [Paenibacillaceae]
MIFVDSLVKEYKQTIRKDGMFSSIRTLFNPNFNIKRAVNEVSFTIQEGELVGYIGPNGAGKSTSIKMLTGILVPTSGHVEVNGIVPSKNRKEHAKQIGVVFGQKTQLWWDIPVIDSLRLLKDIYKVPDSLYKKNIDLFCELLELHQFQNTPVRQLSLGQRMRADLAAALLHSPKILFLDEPTIGVDVVAKERLRAFIKEINREQKVTVLLTTHDMGDIEKLCSRMMIIDRGEVIYDGDIEEIRMKYGEYRTLVIQFEQPVADFNVKGAELVKSDGTKKWFKFNRNEASPSELITLIGACYPIKDLTVEEPEIEEMVRSIYEGKTIDARAV